MREFRVSMKKQQPNISKLRRFVKQKLDEEFNRCCSNDGDEYTKYYYSNDRSKVVILKYDYHLENISFYVNDKCLINLSFEDIDEDLESCITPEMSSVIYEHNCRINAQYCIALKHKEEMFKSYIKEVM